MENARYHKLRNGVWHRDRKLGLPPRIARKNGAAGATKETTAPAPKWQAHRAAKAPERQASANPPSLLAHRLRRPPQTGPYRLLADPETRFQGVIRAIRDAPDALSPHFASTPCPRSSPQNGWPHLAQKVPWRGVPSAGRAVNRQQQNRVYAADFSWHPQLRSPKRRLQRNARKPI